MRLRFFLNAFIRPYVAPAAEHARLYQAEASDDKSRGWQNDWVFTWRSQKNGRYRDVVCKVLSITAKPSTSEPCRTGATRHPKRAGPSLKAEQKAPLTTPGRGFAVCLGWGHSLPARTNATGVRSVWPNGKAKI